MGGVHKKPISVIEKRTRRMVGGKTGRREKRPLSETEKRERSVIVTTELLKTIESSVREFKVVTPYLIMTKHDITYGNAKRVLEILHKKGIIREVSRNRRVRVYVTAS
mgnify:CR=1 FL=1